MQQSSHRRQAPDEPQQKEDVPAPQSNPESRAYDIDVIARAAYQRYEARGREDGHDMDDWLTAERDVRGTATSQATTPRDEGDAG
jgi:hypothetical protein